MCSRYTCTPILDLCTGLGVCRLHNAHNVKCEMNTEMYTSRDSRGVGARDILLLYSLPDIFLVFPPAYTWQHATLLYIPHTMSTQPRRCAGTEHFHVNSTFHPTWVGRSLGLTRKFSTAECVCITSWLIGQLTTGWLPDTAGTALLLSQHVSQPSIITRYLPVVSEKDV